MKKKIISLMLMITMSISIFLTGCGNNAGGDSNAQAASGGKDPSKVLVLSVGDDDIYLNEVNYYALSLLEGMGVPEGTDMSQYYNDSYPTLDDAFKAQLLVQIRQSKILYLKAVEEGITLTDDEQKEMDGLIDEFMAGYDADDLEKYGLDKEVLTKIYTQIGMIRKLEQKIADDSEISTDGESYGTIENMVFLTVKLDESGNAIVDEDGNYEMVSEEEQAKQKQLAEEALTRIKEGEAMEDLIDEYGISSTSGTVHGTTQSLSDTYHLKDGEISDVMETDFGYTIIKMVALEDADYTEKANAYNASSALQDAIDEQEQTWFDAFPISAKDVVGDVWEAFTFQDFL